MRKFFSRLLSGLLMAAFVPGCGGQGAGSDLPDSVDDVVARDVDDPGDDGAVELRPDIDERDFPGSDLPPDPGQDTAEDFDAEQDAEGDQIDPDVGDDDGTDAVAEDAVNDTQTDVIPFQPEFRGNA